MDTCESISGARPRLRIRGTGARMMRLGQALPDTHV